MNKQRKAHSTAGEQEFLHTLKSRFEKNMHGHEGIKWPDVQSSLEDQPEKLWSLPAASRM